MLTGLDPQCIERHCPSIRKGWSTTAFRKFLVSIGYTVIPVTKNSVTNVSCFFWQKLPLTKDHVIVMNSAVSASGASWFLLYNNQLWHNEYRETGFDAMFFLNKPTQDVLLVWHPTWWADIKKDPKTLRTER
jgi:hypothetical protein